MIQSFGDVVTFELFEHGETPDKGCGWEDVADVAERKLDMLDAAEELTDLYTPPGNRFESVEGDWYTIRINDQWRIKFQWDDGDAELAHICDPHD